jgi:hypothetical protein
LANDPWGGWLAMEKGPLVETLLFVLIITAITVLPFVMVIGGVMFLRWRLTKESRVPPSDAEPESDRE